MPAPPQLAVFHVEEQQFYSEPLLNDRAPLWCESQTSFWGRSFSYTPEGTTIELLINCSALSSPQKTSTASSSPQIVHQSVCLMPWITTKPGDSRNYVARGSGWVSQGKLVLGQTNVMQKTYMTGKHQWTVLPWPHLGAKPGWRLIGELLAAQSSWGQPSCVPPSPTPHLQEFSVTVSCPGTETGSWGIE